MESVEGRYLFYTKEDAPTTELWRVGIDGEGESAFHAPVYGWRSFDITSDGHVVVARPILETSELAFDELDPGSGSATEITRVHIDPRTRFQQFHGLGVSPDGRVAVFTTATESEFDLELIEVQW